MKNKILGLIMAIAMITALSLVSTASAAELNMKSGDKNLDKLSKQEIAEILANNPLTLPEDIIAYSNPGETTKLNPDAVQAALNRLNALRRIAGLKPLQISEKWNKVAQYGAELLASSQEFSHEPARPRTMSEEFYEIAVNGTSTSNIAGGLNLTDSIDSFMDDSDAHNIPRVGHRRWQLNPSATSIGFGYATGGFYKQYVAEKVIGDDAKTPCDYDFIAWPASGNFPSNIFDKNTAWSVSVNPEVFQKPDMNNIAITLKRQSDGKTWVFNNKNNYTAADTGLYFNIDISNKGVNNCIIFRPDGIEEYAGIYNITITGLKTVNNTPMKLTYQVDFFDTNEYIIQTQAQVTKY